MYVYVYIYVCVLSCIHGYESKPSLPHFRSLHPLRKRRRVLHESKPRCPSVYPKMMGIYGSSFSSFPPCRHIPTLDPKVFFCYTHTIYPVIIGFLKMVDPKLPWLFEHKVMVIHDEWMIWGYPHDSEKITLGSKNEEYPKYGYFNRDTDD